MHRLLSKIDLVMAIYGYARVSTRDQTLASQEAQLRAAACTKIYAEKVSGAWSDRPQLAKLLKRLDQGDVLIVTRLDRLARSTRDLLNILDVVGKAGETVGRRGEALGGLVPGKKESEVEGSGNDEQLRLRLDLNLDIEVQLKAKIHGDLTLGLLYVGISLLGIAFPEMHADRGYPATKKAHMLHPTCCDVTQAMAPAQFAAHLEKVPQQADLARTLFAMGQPTICIEHAIRQASVAVQDALGTENRGCGQAELWCIGCGQGQCW